MTGSVLESNQLATATSPYLKQHESNSVHWQEWNNQTLEHAKRLKKPILLSIGYAACHWCHVMAHESFEDNDTAVLMNELFINIKVDREERPDVDQIYMAALHAMGEQGGWPLTMFLTPDAVPYWGGTYFPPTPSHGRPAFKQVLKSLAQAIKTQPEAVQNNSQAVNTHLQKLSQPPENSIEPTADLFIQFHERALKLFDPAEGGIKGAPKFPNAPILENWARASLGDPQTEYGKAFLHSIERISNGGIYDHLRGGIARYSVDDKWLVPHFEKMLYDNAHFIRHLVFAHKMTGKKLFQIRIEETIGWLQDEMWLEGQGLASSLDADSDGVEGKFYVWSASEIQSLLQEKYQVFAKIYDVHESGNWEGSTILNRSAKADADPSTEELLSKCRAILLSERNKRIRPGRDDKIVTDWNGYAIRAIAEAGVYFKQPQWINFSSKIYRCVTESNQDSLAHSSLGGKSSGPANASDIGSIINAAITLNEATGNKAYLDDAGKWINQLENEFTDGAGGYYLTSKKTQDLIVRPRCDADEANPSGASQILEALQRYANHIGKPQIHTLAAKLAANQTAIANNSPFGMAGFMNALHTHLRSRHISINKEDAGTLLETAHSHPDMALTISQSSNAKNPLQPKRDEMIHVKKGTAIICDAQTCSAPLTTSAELQELLSRKPA